MGNLKVIAGDVMYSDSALLGIESTGIGKTSGFE